MGCGGSTPVPGSEGRKGKSCDVKNGGFQALPIPFKIATDTEELDVSENPMQTLDGIGQLTKLTKLDANGCMLTTVSAELELCTALSELLLYGNKLKELPPVVGSLSELTTLNLFNNTLKKLPVELGKLEKLEEVNVAANKLMVTTDPTFASWGSVKILSLYDNNLVRMASLAPLLALEELRINGNNLEDMPTLAPSHGALVIFEIHKNRVSTAADDYFTATPALQRLSIWGNKLTSLPTSLCQCKGLVGVQAQENQIASIPTETWPSTLETLFLNSNPITSIPSGFEGCSALKRVNISGLQLDAESVQRTDKMKEVCLQNPDGIFWGVNGVQAKSLVTSAQ